MNASTPPLAASEKGVRPLFPNLRRMLGSTSPAAARCQLCAAAIDTGHRHLLEIGTGRLLCSCRGCWLPLVDSGEANGRLRAVPDRVASVSGVAVTSEQWNALEIPVALVFFQFSSATGRATAFYPSPAGATESQLPLEAWAAIVDTNPRLRNVMPDVEAVLVRGTPEGRAWYIVPIDACYELVGRMRRRWKGFGGGDDVRSEIDSFFAMLDDADGGRVLPDPPDVPNVGRVLSDPARKERPADSKDPPYVADIAGDRVLVAGIGNIFRGDDGFGPAVAARLAALPLPERVRVWDVGVRGVHLAYELLDGGYERVILIDAVSRGEVPGTIYVIEPEAGAIEPAALADAHSMGPDAVLGLLKRLGGAPPRLVIVGCEPASLDEDMTLSEPVAAAIDEAVKVVLRLISR